MTVISKMVGVYFRCLFVILMVAGSLLAKPKDCPEICQCLGKFVDCSSRNLDRILPSVPKWATHLELNRNRLKVIEALSFQHLVHLKALKLKRNQILELSDGAFYGPHKIEKLLLDYNNIRVISKGWLYGLTDLKELTVSHNNISAIDNESWEFCKHITFLDLSYNRLETLEVDTFKHLNDLQKLVLNNNNIRYIKENAFQDLKKLKILHLHNNKIWWTIEDGQAVFIGLNDLTKFNLAGNDIKSINKNAFVGLKNVTYLNLSNNNITSIQKDAFNEVPLLKELLINTTSLICDCNIRWLQDWVSAKGWNFNAQCAFPEKLQGFSLFNVSSSILTCNELPKPRLTKEPDVEIMALKGENVSLNCEAMSSSNSIMTFQWKKDNMEIINADITHNSTVVDNKTMIGNSQLNLRWVNNSNAGKYQCVVSNKFGTTYSNKSTMSVLVFPKFIKRPQNITVTAGETARLECAANGEPQPEIGWKKDGGNDFPAARERRMEYMTNDDVFFILNAKESDMGVYSCTAHNAAGTNVANASLIINDKPSFVKSMEDKEVIAGNIVALQCMASGRPKPNISWLKDGAAIRATERHFFTAEDQLMIIVDTTVSDSGIYQCHLANSLGEVSEHSRLVVKPGETYNNIMGIIIITVVCCAVLTSIVWVVIIYQTRKRPAMPPHPVELNEMADYRDNLTQPTLQLRHCPDNLSEHSSCKDSGTGDSAKRSSDDLVPEEFMVIISENGEMVPSHAPLLHYPRSTNHDRANNESDISVVQSDRD
ncbi:unnamed protein product [Brassicogethes aeneus]|uniref:Ig-like domain-containing protein n=1 Tax=Brassicogethes aeneus TaxID=1431903 RepID=A0A9P0BEF4_BRAAE|nr:unnamed protein product [Brassicogethes aeneus]